MNLLEYIKLSKHGIRVGPPRDIDLSKSRNIKAGGPGSGRHAGFNTHSEVQNHGYEHTGTAPLTKGSYATKYEHPEGHKLRVEWSKGTGSHADTPMRYTHTTPEGESISGPGSPVNHLEKFWSPNAASGK